MTEPILIPQPQQIRRSDAPLLPSRTVLPRDGSRTVELAGLPSPTAAPTPVPSLK